MNQWRRVVGLGILTWLIPFLVASLAFPFHDSARPLFESIMAVAVAGTAVIVGLRYLQRLPTTSPREGFMIGMVWFATCVLLDAPLILFSGFMQMTPGEYLADIALTYAILPIVVSGLAVARMMSGRSVIENTGLPRATAE
jgi:hypothetical protein